MTNVSWKNNADGDWSLAANWSTNVLPGSGDTAVLSTASAHTVTHSTGTHAVAGITATTDLLSITGGSLGVTGTATLTAGLAITGGKFSLAGSGSAVGLLANGGTIAISWGQTFAVSGTTNFDGAQINGPGTIATSGTTTLDSGTSAQLDGKLVWVNSGVVNDGGTINLSYPPAVGPTTIQNAAGASFNFTGDGAAFGLWGQHRDLHKCYDPGQDRRHLEETIKTGR